MPKGIYKRTKSKLGHPVIPTKVIEQAAAFNAEVNALAPDRYAARLLESEDRLKAEAHNAINADEWALAEAIIAVLRAKRQLSDSETTLQARLAKR